MGREEELAELEKLLADVRMLTIVGPGGVGKTRLAVETARRLRPSQPDGVWLVELAPLADGTLVPHAVASALGVRSRADQSLKYVLSPLEESEQNAVLVRIAAEQGDPASDAEDEGDATPLDDAIAFAVYEGVASNEGQARDHSDSGA